jgi:ubiquinone/menaquinone biosynthesis C-methylase UbiE
MESIYPMPDAHYDNPQLAKLYDFDSPWSIDRDFYLSLAVKTRQSILDLGCGTGLLCNAYAAINHDVTGVDPSAAMLSVARQKPHGEDIEWVQSNAQTYQSGKLFDLIIMTGHAFQVLLEDADIQATFAVMRKHLKFDGAVVFESRNPEIDWSKKWNYEMLLQLPGTAVYESRRFMKMDKERMTFELRYQFPDETIVSESELRFLSKGAIEEQLVASGLSVVKVLGDWSGNPFKSHTSREMIFFASSAEGED